MSAIENSQRGRRGGRKAAFIWLTLLAFVPYVASLVADLLLPANLFWLTALSMLAIFVGAIGWARALDEGAMSAHYIAWYWGGSLGLAISAMTYIALMPVLIDPSQSMDERVAAALGLPFFANAGFHVGFWLALMPALVGYIAWWAIVWLRRGG